MVLARSLRYVTLLGLSALVAGIAFSLWAALRSPAPPGEDPDSPAPARRRAQQATQVEMLRTRRAAPTVRLQAHESVTYDDGALELSGVKFFLFGSDGESATVEAPRARSSLVARSTQALAPSRATATAVPASGSIGSWTLDGGVTVTAHGDLMLKTPSMTYDETDGVARTDEPVAFTWGLASGSATGLEYKVSDEVVSLLSEVTASMDVGGMGRVRVWAESAQHNLGKGRFAMRSYRANTERGETLSGARLVATFGAVGGLQLLQGDGGFVLESTHALAAAETGSPLSRLLALEGRRRMEGQRITVGFGNGSEPTSVEMFGQASLTSDAGAAGSASSIAAETLAFDLIRGSLTRARAIGDVDLKGAPEEGKSTGFHLQSENLDAVFDPNRGLIQRIEGAGSIQLRDEGMQSQGSRTFLDPNTDIVTLAGEAGSPASATWLGRKIEANRIEADRRRKTLSARGGVRASFQPEADPAGSGHGDRALPFFRGGEMIYAMADTLILADEGRSARYRDRVRIWQGENRLEAAEVDLNEASGGLEARGDIISTFRQPAPQAVPRSASPSEGIVTVSASTMKYDRNAHRIVYGGRVEVTQGPLRVAGESLVVTLAQDGSSAERMEAEGAVEVRDGGRVGRADRLLVDPSANTMKLMGKGREAIVQDESGQQVVRGSSLTMDRASDRILVESELGGRTWIILKPRQKGAPGVGSDPHN